MLCRGVLGLINASRLPSPEVFVLKILQLTDPRQLTWMTGFPPSSMAMANRMLSWKILSLVAFMMRSMTRSEAPSLSRWHCTSAKLSSPRPPTPELTTVVTDVKEIVIPMHLHFRQVTWQALHGLRVNIGAYACAIILMQTEMTSQNRSFEFSFLLEYLKYRAKM